MSRTLKKPIKKADPTPNPYDPDKYPLVRGEIEKLAKAWNQGYLACLKDRGLLND